MPPFFTGLLPEGRRLRAIRSAVKTSADDELTLLLAVGGDTVGDVQVLPWGTQPATTETRQTAPRLEDTSFAELFRSVLRANPMDQVAIAGMQDKLSSAMIALPVHYQDAVWILKLDPPEHPHLVVNEAFFLAAAKESGLPVAHFEVVHDRKGIPGLLVQRFDRVRSDTGWQALAVEDACQILGRYPADKYRLTCEELLHTLASRTGAPMVAARTLIHQLAFAYISCNGDAHAKNFSLLYRNQEWWLSPAYDLPSTYPYGDTTMALSLNGKSRKDIGRSDFLALGASFGLPERATQRVLDRVVAAAPRWLARLQQLPFPRRLLHKLERACRYRVDRLT